ERGSAVKSSAVALGSAGFGEPIAFLFPGQGSQYPGMGQEAALYLGAGRDVLERADAEFDPGDGGRLSRFLFPPTAFGEEAAEHQRRELADTRRAQPALGALSAGLLALLEELGVRPDMAAGHSYGELVALCAAGALSPRTLFRISSLRGRVMGECRESG